MGFRGSVILDGRDIGTHVFPNAELKIFMTADFDIRTKRRYDELISKGQTVEIEDIAENLKMRDHIDSTRKHSPLRKATDASTIDNTQLSMTEQLELAESWVKECLKI